MKTNLVITLFLSSLLSAGTANSQTSNKKEKASVGVCIAQALPEFPGGEESLMSYLKDNIHYPQTAIDNRIHGRVLISFVVQKTGKISNERIVEGVSAGKELTEEALRVVKEMPDWKPGTLAGAPKDMEYVLPIDFVMPRSAITADNDK